MIMSSPVPTTLERGNILIVDDDPDILFVIKNALEGQPATLYTAGNGRDALAKLNQVYFDILLLDAKLPDVNGFEICRIVKTQPDWQHIKVIIVSANANFEDKVRAYEIGADDYIIKPFKNKEFQARIRVMLNLSLAERGLTQRNTQLLEIIHTFEQISTHTNLKTIADIIINSACKLTNADRGYLFLWDEKRQGHRVAGWHNPRRDVSLDFIPDGKGITGMVKQRGEPLIFRSTEEILKSSYYDDPTVTSVAVSPLKVANRYIGCLLVSMTNPAKVFEPADIDIIGILTNRAVYTIENARTITSVARKNSTV
jgi:CheY-like chemotaxis protein